MKTEFTAQDTAELVKQFEGIKSLPAVENGWVTLVAATTENPTASAMGKPPYSSTGPRPTPLSRMPGSRTASKSRLPTTTPRRPTSCARAAA